MSTESDIARVARIVSIMIDTMVQAHRDGLSRGQVTDIALSVYLSLVMTFDHEEYAIEALPVVQSLLEQRVAMRAATQVVN